MVTSQGGCPFPSHWEVVNVHQLFVNFSSIQYLVRLLCAPISQPSLRVWCQAHVPVAKLRALSLIRKNTDLYSSQTYNRRIILRDGRRTPRLSMYSKFNTYRLLPVRSGHLLWCCGQGYPNAYSHDFPDVPWLCRTIKAFLLWHRTSKCQSSGSQL